MKMPWRALGRRNPFRLEQPFVVAFSGGRTSGLMLHEVLYAWDGAIPEGSYVSFTNTGRERPETLDFVARCAQQWHVPIVWLEYRCLGRGDGKHEHTFEVVDYSTASRCGEPFDALIRARNYVPNRVARFCTTELKVKTMSRWAKTMPSLVDGYIKAIGLRHDEPARVQRIKSGNGEARAVEEIVLPLDEAQVSQAQVMQFWDEQAFDLALRPHESNCDLCFLKRKGDLLEILERHPDLAAWWVAAESGGKRFRAPQDRPSYAHLLQMAQEPRLPFGSDPAPDADDMMECACTD